MPPKLMEPFEVGSFCLPQQQQQQGQDKAMYAVDMRQCLVCDQNIITTYTYKAACTLKVAAKAASQRQGAFLP